MYMPGVACYTIITEVRLYRWNQCKSGAFCRRVCVNVLSVFCISCFWFAFCLFVCLYLHVFIYVLRVLLLEMFVWVFFFFSCFFLFFFLFFFFWWGGCFCLFLCLLRFMLVAVTFGSNRIIFPPTHFRIGKLWTSTFKSCFMVGV